MKSIPTGIDKTQLTEELQALLSQTRPTAEAQAELKANFIDLDRDPEFVASFLRAQFVEDVYRAMAQIGLNKNALSQKLGKSRQYVGRILNESANFTFRTIAQISCALDWRVNVRMIAPDERLSIIKTVTQSVMAVDILSALKPPKCTRLQPSFIDYKTESSRIQIGQPKYDQFENAA